MSAEIHNGHRERMRQRFLKENGEGFADHELLELLLYYAVPRGDTNPLAHKMIGEFSSLSQLIEADPVDISRLCGVGLNTAILIGLQKEMSRRSIQAGFRDRPVLNSLERAKGFSVALLTYQNYERFYVVCMDSRRRVIHTAKIAEGTIHEATVHPRLVVEATIKYQASSVILLHNHPGGNYRPSFEDIAITTKLTQLLQAIDVQVIDHIIVAEGRAFSFLENKMMKEESLEG